MSDTTGLNLRLGGKIAGATALFLLIVAVAVFLTRETRAVTTKIGGNASVAGTTETVVTTTPALQPEHIALGLVPLLIALLATGQVSKITGLGGVGFELAKAGQKPVTPVGRDAFDDTMVVVDEKSKYFDSYVTVAAEVERTDDVVDYEALRADVAKQNEHDPTLLALTVGSDTVEYDDRMLAIFLHGFTNLSYVAFIDDDGDFKGIMTAADCWTLLSLYRRSDADGDPVQPELAAILPDTGDDDLPEDGLSLLVNTGAILDHNLVVGTEAAVGKETTKLAALAKLDESNRALLPILSGTTLSNVVTREQLLADLLVDLLPKDDRKRFGADSETDEEGEESEDGENEE